MNNHGLRGSYLSEQKAIFVTRRKGLTITELHKQGSIMNLRVENMPKQLSHMYIQTNIHIHASFHNQNAWQGTPKYAYNSMSSYTMAQLQMENLYTKQKPKVNNFMSHDKFSRQYLLSLKKEQLQIKLLFASMYTTDVYSKSQNLDLLSLTVTLLVRGSQLREHRSFLYKSRCHHKMPSICIIVMNFQPPR